MAIVDLLEPVDVDDQQGQGLVVTLGEGHLALQMLLQRGAVAHPGEGIAVGGGEGVTVVQGVAQRINQCAEQIFELCQVLFGEAFITAYGHFAQFAAEQIEAVAAVVATGVADGENEAAFVIAIGQSLVGDDLLDGLGEDAQQLLQVEGRLQRGGEAQGIGRLAAASQADHRGQGRFVVCVERALRCHDLHPSLGATVYVMTEAISVPK